MFGYIHASNEPLPPIEPPLAQPAPTPAKPSGPWNNQDTMSIVYFLSCLSLTVVACLTGQITNLPPMTSANNEEDA